MKKVMFVLAVAGMFAFAACNNAPKAEENTDTTPIEEVEVAAEEVAEEAVEATAEEATTEEATTEEAAK